MFAIQISTVIPNNVIITCNPLAEMPDLPEQCTRSKLHFHARTNSIKPVFSFMSSYVLDNLILLKSRHEELIDESITMPNHALMLRLMTIIRS